MFCDCTIHISTKDRPGSLLLCLNSILSQTLKPKKVLVFNDGQDIDLTKIDIFINIFNTFIRKGIQLEIRRGKQIGQVANHIWALDLIQTQYGYRMDDDIVMEPTCLEALFYHSYNEKVGAVAPIVLHPNTIFEKSTTSPYISDVLTKYAIQFHQFEGIQECEHLYSTFLYRRDLLKGKYCNQLSRVGHREETIASHELFRVGYKLIVDSQAIVWHYRAESGGIRSETNLMHWQADDQVFNKMLKKWGVKINEYYIMYNSHGIGDNWLHMSILQRIKEKNKDKKIILGTVYPEIWQNTGVEIISLNATNVLLNGQIDKFDCYKLGKDSKNKLTLKECFEKVYEL